MKNIKNIKLIAFWALTCFATQSMAAFEFKSDEEKYQADQTVQFKIERDEVTSTCGLEIKYGDGYSKIFKFEAGKKTMIETYVYKNPGRYKVDLDGKTIFRGLGTTFSCVGPIQNRIVSVEPSVPSAAIAAKMVTAPSAVPTPVIAPTPAVVATTTASNEAAQVFAHRRALVIGNDSYKTINKLENARADARAIAENLAAVGYQVTMRLDVTEKEMKAVLRNFSSQIEGGDEVFFFFAGHGVQLGAANYLLPTDIAGDNEAQVKDESIQLQRILDEMAERKAKFTLAMIDACRDNPFKSSGRAIGGRGLAPTTAATGQMIIFSAGSGQQALDKLGNDDREKNGLFTRVFIKEMQKSGQPVDRVVKNVRAQVVQLAKSVGHDQVPSIYDQVIGDFYFKK